MNRYTILTKSTQLVPRIMYISYGVSEFSFCVLQILWQTYIFGYKHLWFTNIPIYLCQKLPVEAASELKVGQIEPNLNNKSSSYFVNILIWVYALLWPRTCCTDELVRKCSPSPI